MKLPPAKLFRRAHKGLTTAPLFIALGALLVLLVGFAACTSEEEPTREPFETRTPTPVPPTATHTSVPPTATPTEKTAAPARAHCDASARNFNADPDRDNQTTDCDADSCDCDRLPNRDARSSDCNADSDTRTDCNSDSADCYSDTSIADSHTNCYAGPSFLQHRSA